MRLASMNLKRFSRGPFLYITLGLLVLLILTGSFRGDGEFTKVDTSAVLTAIADGEVKSTGADPVLLLDKEQEIRLELADGKTIGGESKVKASFLFDQGRQFSQALEKAGIDRSQTYVTNAVKHFKFEPRGKRRMGGGESVATPVVAGRIVEGKSAALALRATVGFPEELRHAGPHLHSGGDRMSDSPRSADAVV